MIQFFELTAAAYRVTDLKFENEYITYLKKRTVGILYSQPFNIWWQQNVLHTQMYHS